MKVEIEFQYDREQITRMPLDTVCIVSLGEDLRNVYVGRAACHDLDMPVKAIGRKIALARAIKDLDRATRTQIWKHYHSKFKA